MSYNSRDEGQGAGVVLQWDKLITLGQIPAQSDVSGSVLSGVDGVGSSALAVDGGLE